MIDLFEHHQDQPQELKAVLNNWQESINNGLDYNQCDQLLKEVNAIGYTFDFELSAEPFNLRKMSVNTSHEFESWHETHYEIVSAIIKSEDIEGSTANKHAEKWGTGGMYNLAKELTDKFENKYSGAIWGEELIYQHEIEKFINEEL